ncbi:MAG: L-lactate dehydrogenase [Ruminococcaceae bacterium]|nr:L-lactate dehydrogenase [Oscillospiraceae bacterium]
MKDRKVVIIGAGFVGATIGYTLLAKESVREIVLIDIDKEKAEGEAMDIVHGVPFVRPIKVYSGDYSDCKNADIIILAAGAAQKPGETRTDLLTRNAAVFKSVLIEVMRYCPAEVLLLVVTNPVDILTHITLKITGLSPARVLGSGTVLDTARLRARLSAHTHIDARNIHAYVIGEHGDSEVTAWHSATIAGLPIADFCNRCGQCSGASLSEIRESVKNAAYEIVEKKGATYYAVSLAAERIVRALGGGENSILTVSALCTGAYGLRDVCLSIPRAVSAEGITRSIEIPLSDAERADLAEGAKRLQKLEREIGY